MNRTELISALLSADEEASMLIQGNQRIKVVIVGGGAFVIKNLITRQTIDIDTIGLYRGLEEVFNKYNINSNANAFSDSIAYNYVDRLEKMNLETKIIDYYTMSLEDMVIMKLFSVRLKDKNDIRSPEVLANLNWDKLDKIIKDGELKYTFNERNYQDFLNRYNEYIKECKKS